MRLTLIALSALVAVASAQQEAFPECALKCLDDPDIADLCAGVEPAVCVCTNAEAHGISTACVFNTCSDEDISVASEAATNICIPIWDASGTGGAPETETGAPTSSESGGVPADSPKPRPTAAPSSADPAAATSTRPSDSVAGLSVSIGSMLFAGLALAF